MMAAMAGQVQAATYVVDQAAPGAADTNPGTEEKPFKTIQRAADVVKPGDTVCVMAGKYDERVKVKTGGAEGRPVAFRAMPRRSAIVGGFDLEASYIRVEGFEITAEKPATAVQLRASHCEVLDNYIHDMMVGVAGTVGKPERRRQHARLLGRGAQPNRLQQGLSQRVRLHPGRGGLAGGEQRGRTGCSCTPRATSTTTAITRGSSARAASSGTTTITAAPGRRSRPPTLIASRRSRSTARSRMDLLFEYNTCFDFHQMCMVESAPHIGSVRGWTFRRNIVSPNSPAMRGGWGPDIIQTLDVTIENYTISTVKWAAIGLRGKESTNGQIRNNILCDAERAVDDAHGFHPGQAR